MTYGETIRFLRQRAGMSQGDLARRVGNGLTNQSVSGWERGKAKPSTENLFELARIFGVSVDDLRGGDPAPPPPIEPPALKASGLLFAALEEAILMCGVNREAAAEIAEVVWLAVENLKTPPGASPEDAIRRIMRWEVPDILKRRL
jgi:transcriptional regulator with XRE-family HTH domain